MLARYFILITRLLLKRSCLLLLLLIHPPGFALEFLMINPGHPGNPHWDRAQLLAETAAKQLGVTLTVAHVSKMKRSNRLELERYINAHSHRPDGLFFMAQPTEDNDEFFQYLEDQKIPFITLENTLKPAVQERLQKPGQRFKYWKGEKLFDDYQSGYLLADKLLQQASLRFDGKLSVVGLSGSFIEISEQRNKGLNDALHHYPQAELLQITHTNWEQERAYQQVQKLMLRHPQINVIWAASDNGALGAYQALQEMGKLPGIDVLIGGIDWRSDVFELMLRKEYNVSVGGQVLAATAALVHLYDLANGIPAEQLQPLTNLAISSVESGQQQLAKGLKEARWEKLDFRLLSLKHNPDALNVYSLAALLLRDNKINRL